MSLKNSCVKTYSTHFQVFSIDSIQTLPTHETGMIIVMGRKSYLFHCDQIVVLKEMAERLQELITSAPANRCDYAVDRIASAGKSIVSALYELVSCFPKKQGLCCLGCSFCKDVASFKTSLGLEKVADVQRFSYAVTPQILPTGLSDLGISICRVEPYSINLLEGKGSPVYIPVLDNMKVEERVRLFDLVRKIREIEWRSLPTPISLDLLEIVEQRKAIAKELGRIGEHLIPYTVYSSVGLAVLFPSLLDENVSELFVDRESSLAYLDHRCYGRCNSTIFVGAKDLDRIITFARLSSGRAIDHQSPSIRSSIKTADFHVRVSADVPPLSLEGTSIAIRKFFSKAISLDELVSNSTLTRDSAEYLTKQMLSRRNISIYGESGSGKTTLAVALDLLTPSSWRKISVESDVAENVSQCDLGKHQIRLLAGGSSKPEQERRIMVLNSLLHKSPDYVFFGEVLSREDSESLFQILAAGLKCIHTIHAESAESLLRRWTLQHDIPEQSLKYLDVLVEMRRSFENDKIARRINRISELTKDDTVGIEAISDVFIWDCRLNALRKVSDTGHRVSFDAVSQSAIHLE